MRLLSLIIILFLANATGISQELNCQVEINSKLIEGTNTSVFETLQEAISEYMNTTKFTNTQFSPNEKIDCRLFFTIGSIEDETISGDLQIQSTRPVYNSSYTTTLINFKDSNIEFNYQQGEPLIFNETSMESNLTAILNFYAYLILAMDFDSFSPQGGQPYFDRLATIVQQAQSSGEKGWRAFEDTKNRSAILSAFTDGGTKVLRDMNYLYHRKGLDEMSVSPDKGRNQITQSLDALNKVFQTQPMSVGLSMFKDAKLDELVNIYSKSQQVERDEVYKNLKNIYPTEKTRLEKIRTMPQQQM